jgi:hypothetical protein
VALLSTTRSVILVHAQVTAELVQEAAVGLHATADEEGPRCRRELPGPPGDPLDGAEGPEGRIEVEDIARGERPFRVVMTRTPVTASVVDGSPGNGTAVNAVNLVVPLRPKFPRMIPSVQRPMGLAQSVVVAVDTISALIFRQSPSSSAVSSACAHADASKAEVPRRHESAILKPIRRPFMESLPGPRSEVCRGDRDVAVDL